MAENTQSSNNDNNDSNEEFEFEMLPDSVIKDEFIEYIVDDDDDDDMICDEQNNQNVVNKVRIRNVAEINESIDVENKDDELININVETIPKKKRKYTLQKCNSNKEDEYKIMVRFIKTIEMYDFLWNVESKQFNHNSLKLYHWKVVGYKFDITSLEAYQKFLKLCKTFSDEDMKERETNQPSTWQYMKHLKFLNVNRDTVTQQIFIDQSLNGLEKKTNGSSSSKQLTQNVATEEVPNKDPLTENDKINHVPTKKCSQEKEGKSISQTNIISPAVLGKVYSSAEKAQVTSQKIPLKERQLRKVSSNIYKTQKIDKTLFRRALNAVNGKNTKKDEKICTSTSPMKRNEKNATKNMIENEPIPTQITIQPTNNTDLERKTTESKMQNTEITFETKSSIDVKKVDTTNNLRAPHEDVLEFVQRTFQYLGSENSKSFEKELMMLAMEFRYNKK